MTEPLYVQPDGIRSYAQTHDEVLTALSQLMGAAAPEAASVQTSHGAIASAVSIALGHALSTRQGTLQATSTATQAISGLLQKAAQMYEQGDQRIAKKLEAAAEPLEAKQGGHPRTPDASGGPLSARGDEPLHRAEAASGDSAKTGKVPEMPHSELNKPASTHPQPD